MKHILIGAIIGLVLFCVVLFGTIAYNVPDYSKTRCIYYASQVWCKL